MSRKVVFGVLSGVFVLAAVIDGIGAYLPKLINSITLTLAFMLLAFGTGKANEKQFQIFAFGFLAISIIGFIYRILTWDNLF